MTDKPKMSPKSALRSAELIDDIERVLFKARDAERPFTEYLLYMAFLEEMRSAKRNEDL